MLESSLRLLHIVGDPREVPRTLVKRLDKLCHFTLGFDYSLNNRVYQQLAEMFWWVGGKE